MTEPTIENVDCDVLILGGGMAGCGAAYESAYWAAEKGLRVVLVEKSVIERSGAVAAGLSAINCFMGQKWGWNQPEDFVRYVRRDMMGLCREDLVFDVARHVDSSVHLFEKWGLPICKTPDGRYQREGRWQILIHGESYKPIVAEAASKALGTGNVFERVFVSHLLADEGDQGKIAGAIGFSVRKPVVYVFRAKAVIAASGGATGIFRPHAVGEGLGRTWYAPWNTGSVYKLMIEVGAEMTQMEHRLVAPRFKDGYGPVGMWFLFYKAVLKNAYGDLVEQKWAKLLDEWAPYGANSPIPTPLRVFQIACDAAAGNGPHHLRTSSPMPDEGANAWENFLNMTPAQALVWAAQNLDPAAGVGEIALTEPYLMGSHASGAGAWVGGPEDLAPKDCFWGYNRMTTVRGLFAAGDGVGAAAHKFSSGSYTEGRLAGKAAVAFALDNPTQPRTSDEIIHKHVTELRQPLRTFEKFRGDTTNQDVNPDYIRPHQALLRLQKIMDEYGAGAGSQYRTNAFLLARGIELLDFLRQDTALLAAEDLHELMRCGEILDRTCCAEAHLRHLLFREETRWPGYYVRSDYPRLNREGWDCFVNSRFDGATGTWTLQKRELQNII